MVTTHYYTTDCRYHRPSYSLLCQYSFCSFHPRHKALHWVTIQRWRLQECTHSSEQLISMHAFLGTANLQHSPVGSSAVHHEKQITQACKCCKSLSEQPRPWSTPAPVTTSHGQPVLQHSMQAPGTLELTKHATFQCPPIQSQTTSVAVPWLSYRKHSPLNDSSKTVTGNKLPGKVMNHIDEFHTLTLLAILAQGDRCLIVAQNGNRSRTGKSEQNKDISSRSLFSDNTSRATSSRA
jgi:hypothetical protein